MAHRLYVYNVDSKTNTYYETYLGEWKYEIPHLLYPLFVGDPRHRKAELVFDLHTGIEKLERFYDLLEQQYELSRDDDFQLAKEKIFALLRGLPYDRLHIDATDVFNMNEERHEEQAKSWVQEMRDYAGIVDTTLATQRLEPLQDVLQRTYRDLSFLDLLRTDWIHYGLGYWNEELYGDGYTEVFEEQGKFGINDRQGALLTSALYDDIYAFSRSGYAVVRQAEAFGYLTNKGVLAVPCAWDDAFDVDTIDCVSYVQDIDYYAIVDQAYLQTLPEQRAFQVGIVTKDGKQGVLDVEQNRLLLPADYSSIDHIALGLYNVKDEGGFRVLNLKNEILITDRSDAPYEIAYPYLLYTKTKSTSKHRYYTLHGVYLGEFLEDSLDFIGHGYFASSANKLQKKISLIDPQGQVFLEHVDQLIGGTFENYSGFAIRKNKQWLMFDTKAQAFRLVDTSIEQVRVERFACDQPNTFFLRVQGQWGYYHLTQDRWIIAPSPAHRQIHYCYHGYFRITQTDQTMVVYDDHTGSLSEPFDYVHRSIDDSVSLLYVYRNGKLLSVDLSRQLHEMTIPEMADMHENYHQLDQADQAYFMAHYQKLEQQLGEHFYHEWDTGHLNRQARRCERAGQPEKALLLYRLAAERGNAEAQFNLASAYLDEEEYAEAIPWYEQAAENDYGMAWNDIGYLYQNGFGYEQNIEKALFCYTRAGDLGNGMGYVNAGDLYYYGEYVVQDYDKALDFYLRARKLYQFKDDHIAEIYYQQRAMDKLIKWLKKDKQKSFSDIYYGILYDQGLEVPQDTKKAIKHYEAALRVAAYPHAFARLMFFYGEDPVWKNPSMYRKWLAWGEKNDLSGSG
ncbi:tetratricopeptide repeat protein [Sphingobacterium suaedae]|uniref:Tetratricopeptide repeat protein n=1 Tax=Sphingobacterium suaedae TaxID=1686402 RepID=A0ABW5KFW4_9SPHI